MIETWDKVELRDLAFGYGDQPLFSGTSFTLPTQQGVRLWGSMGCGKSALLRILAGLLTPAKGDYFVNGRLVSEMSFEEFLPWRLGIGYGFDSGGLLNNRSIKENLMLPLEYHKLVEPTQMRRRVDEALERFGLGKVQDQRPAAVSGSQRKAACLARALITQPQFLLLDDPTVGLAESQVRELEAWVDERRVTGELKFLVVATARQDFLTAQGPLAELEIQDHKIKWRNRASEVAA